MAGRPANESRYIECDGYLTSKGDGIAGALSGVMGNFGLGGGNRRNEPTLNWTPSRRFISRDLVKVIIIEDSPIPLSAAVPRVRMPTFRDVYVQQLNVEADDILAEEENATPVEQTPAEPAPQYAPEGYYIVIDSGFDSSRFHVRHEKDGAALCESKQEDAVASALYRIADEIALKPPAAPGSEFLNAEKRWSSTTF